MTSRNLWPCLLAVTLLSSWIANAATTGAESAPSLLTLERIFGTNEFSTEQHEKGRWLPDGSAYVRIEQFEGENAVISYDASQGFRREVVVSARSLVPAEGGRVPKLDSFDWSEDAATWILRTKARDLWTLDRAADRLEKMGDLCEEDVSEATISPDGNRIAYACGNNLHVKSLVNDEIVHLTFDASPTSVNATTEGVYTGLNAGGIRWSPDGTQLAFARFDMEGVKQFQIINNTDALYSTVSRRPHVKPGETLPAVYIGVVDAGGGDVTWLELPGDPRNQYVYEFGWVPDTTRPFVGLLNRLQNTVRLFVAEPDTGKVSEVLAERNQAWLDLRPIEWVNEGRAFLWVSERDGWRHVYRSNLNGGAARLLTPGDFDILSIAAVDESAGWVYFIASPDNPTQRYLYRARLDGTGVLERVTPQGDYGTHEYEVAPDARWAWHRSSEVDTPPSTAFVSLPEHGVVRGIVDNADLKAALATIDISPTEFFRVDIGDGVQLDGMLMKPPDFDPSLRYPVLFYVYGMPAAQTVLDRWRGRRHLFHKFLTQRGYVVISVDNRGTPAPRGSDFRKIIYLQHGVLPARDQASAVLALQDRWPWMDPSRIGIYGWSGGGNVSMNAIFRHPDVFAMAMPGAGLSHHKYYHAAFTERFLGLPQDNPEAYEATAPVNVARNLRGNLLIIHGTGDPNVHYQNAEVLSNALIAANKRFTIMPYPGRRHRIPDGYHLHDLYLWFLEKTMPAGGG